MKAQYNADVEVPQGMTRVWLRDVFPGTKYQVNETSDYGPHRESLLWNVIAAIDLPSSDKKRLELARRVKPTCKASRA
jgi:hypothetical protein